MILGILCQKSESNLHSSDTAFRLASNIEHSVTECRRLGLTSCPQALHRCSSRCRLVSVLEAPLLKMLSHVSSCFVSFFLKTFQGILDEASMSTSSAPSASHRVFLIVSKVRLLQTVRIKCNASGASLHTLLLLPNASMTFLLHSVTFLLKRTPFSASYFSNVRSSSSKNLLKLFHRKELHWKSHSAMRWTATKILENLGCSSTFWHQKRPWHHHFEFYLMSV